VKISEFQKLIEGIYFAKDSNRGLLGTFAWFVEEVGELSRELQSDGKER
jgi:NTP pyrophosphatase (non-canonical NTP hydrolase)